MNVVYILQFNHNGEWRYNSKDIYTKFTSAQKEFEAKGNNKSYWRIIRRTDEIVVN